MKANLENLKSRLDQSKPISIQLGVFMDQALGIIGTIVKKGKSAGATDDALDDQKPKLAKLVSDLQQLVTSTNFLLQQTGSPAVGLATPPAPSVSTSSSASVRLQHLACPW